MSELLVPFLYSLRRRDLRVGTTEMVQLARGLSLGLHGSSLDGFYYLARAILVHREGELDRFDRAFLEHFRGATEAASVLAEELADFAQDVLEGEGRASLVSADGAEPEWLREMLGRRLDEQAEMEDPGEVGRGEGEGVGVQEGARLGRPSPSAARPRVGVGATRAATRASAVGMADARRYRRYRSDVVLDVRQVELALRRLRAFSRDGRLEELDVDGTVDATAKAFGDLEIVLRPPRKSHVRVLLLMDVGGSMEPFAQVCSQLFSAARRASNLRELRAYYFHNIVYGRVFSTDGNMTPVDIPELLDQVNQRWKLVVVGDAQMAPGEMLSVGPWGSTWRRQDDGGPMRGLDWLVTLAERFDRSVWLNPDPPSYWVGGTVEIINQVFQMHTLTLDGLTEAVTYLSRETKGKPPKIIGNPRNAL